MEIDEGLDTGPVMHTVRTPIEADETGGSLHDKLAPLGAELPVLALLAAGAFGLGWFLPLFPVSLILPGLVALSLWAILRGQGDGTWWQARLGLRVGAAGLVTVAAIPAAAQTFSSHCRCSSMSMSPKTPASTPASFSSRRAAMNVGSYASHDAVRVANGIPKAAD